MWEEYIITSILKGLQDKHYIENVYQDDDGIVVTNVYGKQFLVKVDIKSI